MDIEKVKQLRKIKGLTQEALAEKIGVSRNYYTLLESGKRNGGLKTLRKIADALGVKVWEIIKN